MGLDLQPAGFSPFTASAQIIDDEAEDEDDKVENEIILTDQKGDIDEIDFPEAMVDNMDSLMVCTPQRLI